jgi:hypothetical protein
MKSASARTIAVIAIAHAATIIRSARLSTVVR